MQTIMTSRAFNHDVSVAKRAAADGPVIVTDRGEPAFVLLSMEDYRRLRPSRSLADVLEMDEDVEIEFEELGAGDLPRVAEL